MDPIEVFGLGQCTVDRLGQVESFPAADGKQQFSDMVVQCGGPVATALYALARWGRRCAFAGVVGDDAEGGVIREDLEAVGVDTSQMLVREGCRSQYAFIAVERGSGRRMIFWQQPTGAPPAVGEIELPACEMFLTDGLFPEASVEIAKRSKRVVVDAGTLREGTEALLDHAHVFVASESFAKEFADSPEEACARMRERGVELAGVTLGADGYVASFGDTLLHGAAHAVEAVDTTGCGDIFHAGLIEGLLRDWPTGKALDFAAWAAARCAAEVGGRAGIPSAEEYT